MTKETYASVPAVLKKDVGNASATLLLERIVYWCTRKKGGVEYQGRHWSYRQQKEWIELAGLSEGAGKRSWARLVKEGFILAEMRFGGPHGNRSFRMHVALSDKTYDLLDGTHLAMASTKAELALKAYDKATLAEKVKAAAGFVAQSLTPESPPKMTWEQLMADAEEDSPPQT
jgi:hypothetical protein